MSNHILAKRVFIFFCILLGILYRVWLSSLFLHQPLFDDTDYISFAHRLLDGFWYADCCAKTYGYPLYVAFIFMLFGKGNLQALIFSQAILDSLTAFILFLTARRVFSRSIFSYITFFVYLFNPLTASYTGLYLSEVFGLFLMSLVLYVFISAKNGKSQFLLGLLLGLLTFTRVMLWWWSIVFLVVFFFWNLILEKKKLSIRLFVVFFGFFLMILYPLYSNWKFFTVVSPLPPVPFVYLDFLHSLEISRWPGLYNEEYFREVPVHVSSEHPKVFGENRDVFMEKVQPRLSIALSSIQKDPVPFALSRVRNILFFWDKSHLYFYTDPFYPSDKIFVRTGNILFLIFSLIGVLFVSLKKRKSSAEKRILLVVSLLLLYFTLPLSLLTPEERITMPVYPVLTLFTPLGLYSVYLGLRSVYKRYLT